MSIKIKGLIVALLAAMQLFSGTAYAGKDAYVPDSLKPWKKWVLEGVPDLDCPFLGGNGGQPLKSNNGGGHLNRVCSWSSPLILKAIASGAKFSQKWTLYDDATVQLPGDSRNWPVKIEVDGKPVPVTAISGRPTLSLKKGVHPVNGSFEWKELPKWLTLPASVGVVNLSLDGKRILFPEFNGDKIALGSKRESGDRTIPESLAVKVFRKISDQVPLKVITRIVLDVSGPGREVLLGRALLADHIPMRLQSPLPARLEPDGRLRLQVKPGHWQITLLSRITGPVSKMGLTDPEGPWAANEIWSYQSNTTLRLTELSGLKPVDPQQTGVPREWAQFPAYRAEVGNELLIREKRRGNSDPVDDSLKIKREIWLDFDGTGYTVRDNITGTMNKGWRLDSHGGSRLGRVSIGGQDQLITFSKDGKSAGSEIRQGAVNISAVSRIEDGQREFNAVGWQHDFDLLRATLFLPPGYEVLTATGMDKATPSWITRWSLFDLFVLLIIAAAVHNLRGRRWGLAAFLAIGLIYHEPGAPLYVWLSIVASMGLLTVLPEGRFRNLVTWYRNGSFVALLIISIPFMIDQARQSLYPQLESRRSWSSPMYMEANRFLAPQKKSVRRKAPQTAPAEEPADRLQEGRPFSSMNKLDYYESYSRDFKKIDPDAQIQTGPGLPGWKWNRVTLSWNGPVAQDLAVKLYLIPPLVNAMLGFLRIALVALLFYGLLNIKYDRGKGFSYPMFQSPTAVALLLLLAGVFGAPDSARADLPTPEMLNDLKARLLSPPDCGSACFDMERARVDIEQGSLLLRLEVHAKEHLAVPLPGKQGQWFPDSVMIDGKKASQLSRRSGRPGLWLRLSPGIHRITLKGPLPNADAVRVFFPHRPHKFTIRSKGWEVDGVKNGLLLSDSLQLTRIQSKTDREVLRSEAPPPFVLVDRVLRLGLDWQVQTRVTRMAPDSGAINLQVPVLPGESVLTENVKLSGSNVMVALGAAQRQVHWVSALEKTDQLKLTASQNSHWVERWTLDASSIFHIDYEGLPAVVQQSRGEWKPQFSPWPGETLALSITRPKGVPGSTLAIDSVHLVVTPGARVMQSDLKLTLRSSRGGQHGVTLEEGAVLETVLLNGKTQPIRQEGRTVTLPLSPGTQTYNLKFKTKTGVGFKTATPQIDLGAEAANVSLQVRAPRNRWVLFAEGPSLGPAVLFWGELFVVLILAMGLGRIPLTPLKTRHWVLLGVAMSTIAVTRYLIVVGWLFALAKRKTLDTQKFARWQFNLGQSFLGLLTLVALICLFTIIPTGLLGSPDMDVVGNGSSAHLFNWYQDRITDALPLAWFFSVPLIVYRIAILLWALWMAFALLKWLRWGWECFSVDGIWRAKEKKKVIIDTTEAQV